MSCLTSHVACTWKERLLELTAFEEEGGPAFYSVAQLLNFSCGSLSANSVVLGFCLPHYLLLLLCCLHGL